MSEFYLVLPDDQREITTLEEARAVADGLAKHLPDKTFKVYRCKRYLHGAKHFQKMVALLGEIVAAGLTQSLRDRADILLGTVAKRNETPHLTRRVVPEFEPRRPE
ncbi:MAG TPA: hypothetical protein VHZ78_08670 [Rhizomicrobium sp.]|jgi:hypothetical protein|nr:hypothetical protein [Rhizomicrobium sp.]